MTIQEAIEARHSVRAYKEQPLEEAVAKVLIDKIAELNQELEEKGYLTVKGKVPKKYLEKRFGLGG